MRPRQSTPSLFSHRQKGAHPPSRRAPGIGALTCGGVGLLLLLVAGAWAWSNAQFRKNALSAPGTVVRLEVRRSKGTKGRSSVFYCPVVRFKVRDGREIEFEGLGSDPADYEEGDRVTVLYPEERPTAARIGSFQEQHAGPLAVGAFGVIFTTVGLFLWRMDV